MFKTRKNESSLLKKLFLHLCSLCLHVLISKNSIYKTDFYTLRQLKINEETHYQ